MNEIQQRIAIAEACGWKPTSKKIKHYSTWKHDDGRLCIFVQLPNYLKDLNAIWHAVRKGLTGAEKLRTYEAHLQDLCPDYPTEAVASQRAEAFLKTLNLWTDE